MGTGFNPSLEILATYFVPPRLDRANGFNPSLEILTAGTTAGITILDIVSILLLRFTKTLGHQPHLSQRRKSFNPSLEILYRHMGHKYRNRSSFNPSLEILPW